MLIVSKIASKLCMKTQRNILLLTELEEGKHKVGCSSCTQKRRKSCVTTNQTCLHDCYFA
uniref:Uncharacterized protein n=1 Tax=Arundo donax TaxID=35708 RepID=A0A0A8XS49_ARUDO